MKRYCLESGNAALIYLGIFSIGFFTLTFIYDWLQDEKAYREGRAVRPGHYMAVDNVDSFEGLKGYTVKY